MIRKHTILLLYLLLLPNPLVAQGATYFVAKTGDNNNTCLQAKTLDTPKLTIAAGLACLAASDTLTIKAGTYVESIAYNAIPSGTASASTIVQGAPSETVIIMPSTGNAQGDAFSIYDRNYITVNNLTIDGTNVPNIGLRIGGATTYAHDILIKDSTIRNTPGNSCVSVQGSVNNSNLQFIRLHVYNCAVGAASSGGHGISLSSVNSLVESCEIHNASGMGIHNYSGGSTAVNNNVVRYNYIHDCGSYGILLGSGHDNIAYRNTLVRNGTRGGAGGMYVYAGGIHSQFYQNVIFDHPGNCGFVNLTNNSDAIFLNNICYANTNNTIKSTGVNTIIDHNVFTNPLFTDAAAGDFTLTEGSPAIDAGAVISPCPSGMDCSFTGAFPDAGTKEVETNLPSPMLLRAYQENVTP